MMPPHLRPVLVELRSRLAALFGPRLLDLQLFGSYARGEATEDSDVDVFVLISELAPNEIALVADATSQLALETGLPLAAVPMASSGFAPSAPGRRFLREIERDGERP
jgi:predicted nucleotidyltransferase